MRARSILLVLPLLLVSCGEEDEPAAKPSTTTTVATTSTSTAEEGVDLGEPIDLGPGVAVGVHPEEELAYLSVLVPGEVGCEGGDLAKIVAQPLDGGTAVEAGTGRGAGEVLHGGAGGRVLVVDQCEGFLSRLVSGVPGPDGAFTDVQEVEIEPSAEGRLVRPTSIRWSRDGRSLLAIEQDEVLQGIGVVRSRPGEPAELVVEDPDVIAVDELEDGSLVTATAEGVTIGDEEPVELAVTSIVVSPDGRRVAVFGDDGVVVLEPGRDPQQVDDEAASVGSWSPDGESLAYLRLIGDEAAVWLTDLVPGTTVEVAAAAGFGEPRFTADGRALVYNAAVDSGEGYDEPRATARRIRA